MMFMPAKLHSVIHNKSPIRAGWGTVLWTARIPLWPYTAITDVYAIC